MPRGQAAIVIANNASRKGKHFRETIMVYLFKFLIINKN